MSLSSDALGLLIFRPSRVAVAGFAQQRLTRRLIGIEVLEPGDRTPTVSLSCRGWAIHRLIPMRCHEKMCVVAGSRRFLLAPVSRCSHTRSASSSSRCFALASRSPALSRFSAGLRQCRHIWLKPMGRSKRSTQRSERDGFKASTSPLRPEAMHSSTPVCCLASMRCGVVSRWDRRFTSPSTMRTASDPSGECAWAMTWSSRLSRRSMRGARMARLVP
ncbi:hypothetical protein NB689_000064 [Xanthomonas sacchari]|nr:hypothetical protein [Xanthomonas sacchari]MCW0414310.1 hypothetical protein [Xanthomonas sacchari]